MMNEQGLLRTTEPETSSIGKLGNYEYGTDETNDIHADTDNLHNMFDVSLSMVPDIEGTLLCTETLSASGSDNDELGLKQVSMRQRCVKAHHHHLHHGNNSSSDREDSGFTSSESSSSPQEVPNRSISPSGSEADAEESDTEMEQHIGEGTMHFNSLEMNPALFVSNAVTANANIQRRNVVRTRETMVNAAILRSNEDSVVPSSPTFGTSTLSGDAYVPYIDSDELVSDASSSDGDNGRHMYSCISNDHVVPQIYIEE